MFAREQNHPQLGITVAGDADAGGLEEGDFLEGSAWAPR